MFNKVLITGNAGFIGSNLFDYLYKNDFAKEYVTIDALKTGSNSKWLEPYLNKENVFVYECDLSEPATYHLLRNHLDIDGILHLAAESHVDRSINDAYPFGVSNMLGSMLLLEFCKELDYLKLFLNFSTDEVMGQRLPSEGAFKIDQRKKPRNPYSATKSAQEDLGFSYAITHGIPVITTRCTNIYGRRQYTEKFLPTIINKLSKGEKIPLYGEGLQEREWIHVDDACRILKNIIDYVMKQSYVDPEMAFYNIYHIAGKKTYPNIEFMKTVIKLFNQITKGTSDIANFNDYFEFVEDRKGHDFRYDLDDTCFIKNVKPEISLEDGLKDTIEWYLDYFRGLE